jgi:hypothetical protein
MTKQRATFGNLGGSDSLREVGALGLIAPLFRHVALSCVPRRRALRASLLPRLLKRAALEERQASIWTEAIVIRQETNICHLFNEERRSEISIDRLGTIKNCDIAATLIRTIIRQGVFCLTIKRVRGRWA